MVDDCCARLHVGILNVATEACAEEAVNAVECEATSLARAPHIEFRSHRRLRHLWLHLQRGRALEVRKVRRWIVESRQ